MVSSVPTESLEPIPEESPASAPRAPRAPATVSHLPPAAPAPAWPFGLRVLFRFFFSYVVFEEFPAPLTLLPGTDAISGVFYKGWERLVLAVGHLVLHRDVVKVFNGSGDTTFSWIRSLSVVVLAAVATALWSVLDRRRKEYRKLHGALRLVVRLVLAQALIGYGSMKFLQTQFPAPTPSRLLERVGDQSPMGLLWTFMGASATYNVFAGLGETVPGLLLFFRRTTTLGALLGAAVMSNVVMLNMAYDVPVKLYSSQLFLYAAFLALPDFRRLANVLVLNRPALPAAERAPFKKRWLVWGHRLARAAILGFIVFFAASHAYEGWKTYGAGKPRPDLYGVYKTETVSRDGVEAPKSDASRWLSVTFDGDGWVRIGRGNEERTWYKMDGDPTKDGFVLQEQKDQEAIGPKIPLAYTRPDAEHLTLEGTFEGVRIHASLVKKKFELLDRGFHWVNEFPYNH